MRPIRIYGLLLALLIIVSCSNGEDTEIPVLPEKEVRLILPSNGLGDMSFSDDIMRGVLKAQKELGFSFHYHVPSDTEDARKKMEEWDANFTATSSLTIFGSNEYEELAKEIQSSDDRHQYLLIEASSIDFDIPVFRFSGYGVSFLTGIAAYSYTQKDTAVYLGGQQNHSYIEECRIGFRDGYLYAGGKEIVTMYLSDKPDGFSMAQAAYNLADSLYRSYSFIYPVAGGSNSGIYRWLRTYPGHPAYAAGVDVDQSVYSDHIIGSMIKEIGRSLFDYIGLWIAGEELPRWNLFDLQSEYTYFLLSEPFREELEKVIDSYKDITIEKEQEYNKGRYE